MLENPRIRLAIQCVLALIAMRILQAYLGALIWLITAAAGAVCLCIYLLRNDPDRLEPVYNTAPGKMAIDLVARYSGQRAESPPVAEESPAPSALVAPPPVPARPSVRPLSTAPTPDQGGLLACDAADFEVARDHLNDVVRGRAKVIDQVVDSIQTKVSERRTRGAGGSAHLGTYLLLGSNGVGKGYFAEELGTKLVPASDLIRLDLRRIAHLPAGTAAITRFAGRQACRVLILEHLEAASANWAEWVGNLAREGVVQEAGSALSIRNGLIFLTSTQAALTTGRTPGSAQFAGLPEGTYEVITFPDPTPLEQAEVIASLMQRECERQGVRLRRVAPEVLVDFVRLFRPESGFGPLVAGIGDYLREPIINARQAGATEVDV